MKDIPPLDFDKVMEERWVIGKRVDLPKVPGPPVRRVVDWKALSRLLCQQHNDLGVAHVRPWDPPHSLLLDAKGVDTGKSAAPQTLVPTNVTREFTDLLAIPGAKLDPKKVRSMLWAKRHQRGLQRQYFFLWSIYDVAKDISWIGWGAYVPPAVNARLDARSSPIGA